MFPCFIVLWVKKIKYFDVRWNDFAKAINEDKEEERKQRLYSLISGLPQPNRDTLAFLVLHLQR